MDYGNVGPGNIKAQNFERSMIEAPKFNPETLPTPDDKEKDPGAGGEAVGDSVNGAMYLDPSMLGASTVNAMQFDENGNPELGEIVSEENVGMQAVTGEVPLGTDIDASKFNKHGVSKEMEQKLDNIKKIPDLRKQAIEYMMTSKMALSHNYADRKYLTGGAK